MRRGGACFSSNGPAACLRPTASLWRERVPARQKILMRAWRYMNGKDPTSTHALKPFPQRLFVPCRSARTSFWLTLQRLLAGLVLPRTLLVLFREEVFLVASEHKISQVHSLLAKAWAENTPLSIVSREQVSVVCIPAATDSCCRRPQCCAPVQSRRVFCDGVARFLLLLLLLPADRNI